MPQGASGDHRHQDAAGGSKREQQQRELIPNASGGVLIHDGLAQVVPVEADARLAHCARERGGLAQAQPPNAHCHQERPDLSFADASGDDLFDPPGDLFGAQLGTVALLPEELCWQHGRARLVRFL
jgi:hypothetical protein